MRLACAVAVLLGTVLAGAVEIPRLANGGLEEPGADGCAAGWFVPGGFRGAAATLESPHTGQRAGRIEGDSVARAWRQEIKPFPTGLFTVSGWFRGRDAAVRGGTGSPEFARLYCHVLYAGRPYADATHLYADLPTGTYDWRCCSVSLVPAAEWPVESVWVTVAARLGGGSLDFDDLGVQKSPPCGGALALEWENGLQAKVLTDLRVCTPATALAARLEPGRWKVIPYAAGGRSGHLLWGAEESCAPAVTLPLGVSGWHAVYVGLADPAHLGCEVFLRLTGRPTPVLRATSGGVLQEVFLTVDDLSGQDLEIAPQSAGHAKAGGVAFVKLVPLTAAEVAAWQADRSDPAHRRLTVTLDGFSFLYNRRPVTEAGLRAEIEPLRDADVDTLLLQMGGADMVNYASEIGEMRGLDNAVFARRGDRYYAEAIASFRQQGVNPTQVLLKAAQELGVKVHVAVRPAAWMHSEPLSEFFNSRFYQAHPEWRCVDQDGTAVVRMSLAVAPVRAHLVDVLREAVRLGAEGAAVLYTRGVPLVLYESAFLERFQERFGLDARTLAEGDDRVRQLRGEILTGFMQEVRTMLDQEGAGRSPPRRLELSATVLATEADNLRYGIDVRRWVADGLLDQVCPAAAGGGTAKTPDLAFFRSACGGTRTQVRPQLVAWQLGEPSAFLPTVYEWYDAGADGVTLWDGTCLGAQPMLWPLVRRLGHCREPQARYGTTLPKVPSLRFQRLGDVVMDGRYSPNWGY